MKFCGVVRVVPKARAACIRVIPYATAPSRSNGPSTVVADMRRPELKYLRSLSHGLAWGLGLMFAVVMVSVLGDMQSWRDWVRDHALGLLL